MGHRLISALILLNALGLVLCVVLITAAISSDDPADVAQVSEAVKLCLRLFVAGAALPTVAWGILAFEFDRSHSKKKLFESRDYLRRSDYFFDLVFVLPMAHCQGFVIARLNGFLADAGPTPSGNGASPSLDRWTIRTIRSYGSGWGPDGVASPATRSGETRGPPEGSAPRGPRSTNNTSAYAGR